ncbi:MAG: putative Acyl-CoA dehydrogenase [Aeromicrobium sp.]|nr:putative Acyl-CoA dehydrogenase [Aeromicrobium sp.]
MDLLPTSDQDDIVSTAASVLAKEFPTSSLRDRAGEAEAAAPKAWSAAAATGLLALGLSEEAGGAGFGVAEEALLFREIGRHLAPGPFLSTVLAGHVALSAGDTELVERLASGEERVALLEPAASATVSADGISGEGQLRDGEGATLALVLRRDLACLVPIADIADVRPFPPIDPGVRLARVTLDGVRPTVVAAEADVASLHLRGLLLAAAELVGIARATLSLSVEHAKTRVQFGKPIGVNQAIKHSCAQMAVRAERAESQLYFAAASLAGDREDAEFQIRSAKVVATAAAKQNASATIQVHGGMGWTSEFDAHLFVERAEVVGLTLDSTGTNLAALINLPAPQ